MDNFFIAESVALKIYRSYLWRKNSLYSCIVLFPHLFKHRSLAKEYTNDSQKHAYVTHVWTTWRVTCGFQTRGKGFPFYNYPK